MGLLGITYLLTEQVTRMLVATVASSASLHMHLLVPCVALSKAEVKQDGGLGCVHDCGVGPCNVVLDIASFLQLF